MPLVVDEFAPQQEFNRFFADVVNCELAKPPYLGGRVPYSFFFRKRRPLARTHDFGLDRVYDLWYDGTNWYAYGVVGDEIRIMMNDASTTVLKLDGPEDGQTYKFIFPRFPVGAVYDSGFSTSATAELTTLTDSSKSWGTNTLAGKYVYVYAQTVSAANGVGMGQWARIASNAASVITLEGSFAGSGVLNGRYRIYSELGSAPSVTHQDGVYVVHKPTGTTFGTGGTVYDTATHTDGEAGSDVTLLRSMGPVADACYQRNRFFVMQPAVSGTNSVWISRYPDGGAAIPASVAPTTGTITNGVNVFAFQEYVVYVGTRSLHIVRETVVTDSDGNANSIFSLQLLTDNFGILSRGAYCVYNQSLYMVTNQRRFVAVGITPVYTNQYRLDIQQQGLYAQGRFDAIADTDEVSIAIDEADVWVVRTPMEGDSEILRYDIIFKGWHRWLTSVPVFRAWNGDKGSPRFLADGAYAISSSATFKDVTSSETQFDYAQSLVLVAGDARPRTVKSWKAIAFTVGSATTKGATVTAGNRIGSVYGEAVTDLKTAGYLTALANANPQAGQGGNLEGPYTYPPGSYGSNLSVADISVIEWHISMLGVLCILTFSGAGKESFEFGGASLAYEEGSPLTVPAENQITL